MNRTYITLLVIAASIIAACSSSKKNISTIPEAPALGTKPVTGIYPPGKEELSAIQTQYREVTMEQLQQGYAIYAKGACINCHGAMNIYKRTEVQWKGIIEDMAKKARITDAQKDAVHKYVLAIKAARPKAINDFYRIDK